MCYNGGTSFPGKELTPCNHFTRGLCCLLSACSDSCALADEERDALFDAALEGLLTPAQQADLDGA